MFYFWLSKDLLAILHPLCFPQIPAVLHSFCTISQALDIKRGRQVPTVMVEFLRYFYFYRILIHLHVCMLSKFNWT